MPRFKCGSCGRVFQSKDYQPEVSYSCPSCQVSLQLAEPQSGPRAPSPERLPVEVRRAPSASPLLYGRFMLVAELGHGAMGTVHKCWDTKLKRWVAIKVLIAGAADPEGLQRFRQEASVVASMDHPNIAPVYDVLEEEGRYAFVMKYIDGKTAQELFISRSTGLPPVEEVVRCIRDASLGMGYAHERGFVHRDLKPANIMISTEGRVYVLDFGFAKVLARKMDLTNFGRILGTPAYMSPEQAMGLANAVDPRSDVFSLGATLWALLAGRKPFHGTNDYEIAKAILNQPTPGIRAARPDVPEALERALNTAMDKDRERRYPTAVEFASDLNACLVQSEHESESKRVLEPIPAPKHSSMILVIDDDPNSIRVIRECLAKDGIEVVGFPDGASAMEHAGEYSPGVVLLDVNMPGMSGWEILERLRRIPSYESVPILMVTGEGGEENAVRGFHLGADDYIEKPFSLALLRARVRRHLIRGQSAG